MFGEEIKNRSVDIDDVKSLLVGLLKKEKNNQKKYIFPNTKITWEKFENNKNLLESLLKGDKKKTYEEKEHEKSYVFPNVKTTWSQFFSYDNLKKKFSKQDEGFEELLEQLKDKRKQYNEEIDSFMKGKKKLNKDILTNWSLPKEEELRSTLIGNKSSPDDFLFNFKEELRKMKEELIESLGSQLQYVEEKIEELEKEGLKKFEEDKLTNKFVFQEFKNFISKSNNEKKKLEKTIKKINNWKFDGKRRQSQKSKKINK